MKALKTVGTTLKNTALKCTGSEIIIGIDPGLAHLGIGIISLNNNELEYEIGKKEKKIFKSELTAKLIDGYEYILLKIKQNRKIEEKLEFIFDALNEVIKEYNPKLMIVEDAFVGVNKNSALKLGIVRGCILTAIGKNKIPFETVSPRQIKMEITTSGAAQKEEIQETFSKILPNWPKEIKFDCSDAIAAAFCGIKHIKLL